MIWLLWLSQRAELGKLNHKEIAAQASVASMNIRWPLLVADSC
ncbi:hypothetical protein [Shewanella sp.]